MKAVYSILKDTCYNDQQLCELNDSQYFKNMLIEYPSFAYLIVGKNLEYLLYNFNGNTEVKENDNQIIEVKKHLRIKLGV